jgi:hypothetical protein
MHAVNTAQRFNPTLSTGFEFTTDNTNHNNSNYAAAKGRGVGRKSFQTVFGA